MPYKNKHTLTGELGNNAFAWDERTIFYGKSPTLSIPSLTEGDIDDLQIGEDIVFEEIENGIIKSCKGLKHFVKIMRHWNALTPGWSLSSFHSDSPFGMKEQKEIVILDNHNHALYFWLDAMRRGIISHGCELIHIDEHSDLWANEHMLDLEKALADEKYAWEFTNYSCNVGNYIQPAISSWLIGKMIRIENEFQIDEYMDYTPPKNSILNIDIDIFSDELGHIDEEKKVKIIQNLLKKCSFATIATSPYFIDQWKALEKLEKILKWMDPKKI